LTAYLKKRTASYPHPEPLAVSAKVFEAVKRKKRQKMIKSQTAVFQNTVFEAFLIRTSCGMTVLLSPFA
jgi:hypothetical protein